MSLKYTEKKQGRYKRNSIKVDLHRAKKISTSFKKEIKFYNKFPSQQILKTYHLYKKMKKMSLKTWNHFLVIFQKMRQLIIF